MNQPRDDQTRAPSGSRLLIGLGSTGLPSGALDAALDLAAALQAEISALFVEEQSLYDLIDLPITSLIASAREAGQRLSREAVSEALKAQAKAIRRDLSMRAERLNLRWSFELQQGDTLAAITASARATDIVLLAGTAATITPRGRVALAARLSEAVAACMVVPESLRNRRGAVVLIDPTDHQDNTLARRIAEALGERFVAIEGEADTQPSGLEAALGRLRPRLVIVRNARSFFSNPATVVGLMRAGGAPILFFKA